MTRRKAQERQYHAADASVESLTILLSKEFLPRDAERNDRIETAIRTLATQALADSAITSDNAIQAVAAMRDALDAKIREQLEPILHHPRLRTVETAWRGLIELAAKMPNSRIRVIDMPDEARAQLIRGDTDAVILRGTGLGPLLPRHAGTARIDSLTVEAETDDWVGSSVLGTGDMARQLGVARTTLDNWRRAHRALAIRKGVRNFAYPTRQFERNAPIIGLDQVRTTFPDDESCWEWLVSPNHQLGGSPPIDRLRGGELDAVVRAAEGAFDFQ